MDPQAQFACYLVAVACFVIAALHTQAGAGRLWPVPIRWVAAGLVLATIPAVWAAAVAGW